MKEHKVAIGKSLLATATDVVTCANRFQAATQALLPHVDLNNVEALVVTSAEEKHTYDDVQTDLNRTYIRYRRSDRRETSGEAPDVPRLPMFTSTQPCPTCRELLHWSTRNPPTVSSSTRDGSVTLTRDCISCGYRESGFLNIERYSNETRKEEENEHELGDNRNH